MGENADIEVKNHNLLKTYYKKDLISEEQILENTSKYINNALNEGLKGLKELRSLVDFDSQNTTINKAI